MRNKIKIIETKLKFFIDQGKPLSDIVHDLWHLKSTIDSTTSATIISRLTALEEEQLLIILNFNQHCHHVQTPTPIIHHHKK